MLLYSSYTFCSIFASLAVLLILGSLWAGWRAHKGVATLPAVDDFFLANHTVGFFSLVFTLVATQVGGGMLCGLALIAVDAGPYAIGYSLGQAIGFIVLSLGVGARMRMLKVKTIAEIFSLYYKSLYLRRLAGLLSVLSLAGILISTAIALKKFLMAIGIKQTWVMVLIWSILVGYTVMGGLRAVIATDVVQIFFIITALIVVVSALYVMHPTLMMETWHGFDWEEAYYYSHSKVVDWIGLPFLFMFIEQDMAQRFFAGANNRTVNRACAAAGVMLISIACIPVMLGMVAGFGNLSTSLDEDVFMKVVDSYTSPWVSAVAAVAVLAAIMSTADSLLMAISAHLCQDFWPNGSLKGARAMTTLTGLLALLFAYVCDDIMVVLMKSYAIPVCCLLVPILSLLWRKRENPFLHPYPAWGAVLSGLFSFAFLEVMMATEAVISFPLPTFLLSIACSLLGFGMGYLLINQKSIASVTITSTDIKEELVF